mmetsp:Transcript_27076/g.71370  ORF Transcript_27076/g.71370 Transcript_27076/m.71370 type:complete len:112 (+) Transcript_27076:70-405(+)
MWTCFIVALAEDCFSWRTECHVRFFDIWCGISFHSSSLIVAANDQGDLRANHRDQRNPPRIRSANTSRTSSSEVHDLDAALKDPKARALSPPTSLPQPRWVAAQICYRYAC